MTDEKGCFLTQKKASQKTLYGCLFRKMINYFLKFFELKYIGKEQKLRAINFDKVYF